MLPGSLLFTGELIALGVAFLWGLAAIIWTAAGEKVSAMELNLTKSVAALGLVSVSLLLTRIVFVPIPKLSLFLMLLSGVVGIGVGDVAMFAAFQKIGPTRTSMIKLLSPLLVSLGAFLSLNEKLALVDFIGMAVTILGIFMVVSERLPYNRVIPGQFWAGVGLALIATLAEVAQVVLTHQVLVQTQLDPLWGTFLRLAAAAVFLFLWAALTRQRLGGWLHIPESGRLIKLVSTGVFLGTFIGLWLQQVALKISPAGIAQTFFSSTPLFILLIQSLMQRHLPSPRALGGVLISLVGTTLIFLGG
jgi:drug/metabolite transporter (DMT)-like permease